MSLAELFIWLACLSAFWFLVNVDRGRRAAAVILWARRIVLRRAPLRLRPGRCTERRDAAAMIAADLGCPGCPLCERPLARHRR